MVHSPAPLIVAVVVLHGLRVSPQEGVLDLRNAKGDAVPGHCSLNWLIPPSYYPSTISSEIFSGSTDYGGQALLFSETMVLRKFTKGLTC